MMNRTDRRIKIVLFFLPFILLACSGGTVYHENKSLEASKWASHDSLVFNALITDTVSPHSIFLSIRNRGNYPFSNFYAFITTHAPSGATRTDTIEFILADKRGKWTGKGFGDLWQQTRPFKLGIRFPHTGMYSFTVRQGMRAEELDGIADFGIRINKLK